MVAGIVTPKKLSRETTSRMLLPGVNPALGIPSLSVTKTVAMSAVSVELVGAMVIAVPLVDVVPPAVNLAKKA